MGEKTYKIELEEFDVFVLMNVLMEYAYSEHAMYMDWKDSTDPAKLLAIADTAERLEDILNIIKKIDPDNSIIEEVEKLHNEIKMSGILNIVGALS